MLVKCPHCGKSIKWDPANKWRPFCSERCKLIDLGAWMSEEHAIPGEPATDELLESASDDRDPDRSH